MDSNQVRIHDSDGMIVHSDSLATDALSHTFLTDDYMPQDDMDGTGMLAPIKCSHGPLLCVFRLISFFVCSDNSNDSFNDGPSKHAPLREQDRFLPIANIAKIMKRAIPDNGKVTFLFQSPTNQ